MPTSPPTTECADACEFADNICEIRCFLLPRLRSLPLYHSHPQTALPDLFVFFRRFVRQPKEILRFCGQHEKNRESFKKFSNNYRKNQTSLAQNLAFCQCCTKTYFAAASRRRQKKTNKTGASIGRKYPKYCKTRSGSIELAVFGGIRTKAVCALRRIWRRTCSSD